MGDLRFKNPDTGAWDSIPVVGEQGPTGPPGPVGPPSGGVNVVAWAYDAEADTGAVNVLTDIISTTAHIKPDSFYELTVGWRCISDYGAAGLFQFEVDLNGVALPTHSVLSTGADDGLWGALTRSWIRKGDWCTDVEIDAVFKLRAMSSVANRRVYSPEISIVELSDPNAPTGGGGATSLDDLNDADTTTTPPADGDVLTYDATALQWVPGAPAAAGGGVEEVDYDAVTGDLIVEGANDFFTAQGEMTVLGHQAGAYAGGVGVGALSVAGNHGTAVGSHAGTGMYSAAFGYLTNASGNGSVAIGTDSTGLGAVAPDDDQIVIGTALSSVVIPGASLTVGGVPVTTRLAELEARLAALEAGG